MTEEQDRTWRSRRRDVDRTRIRRITAGLEEEAEAQTSGTLVPRRPRLAPAEHWRPLPPDGEQAEEPQEEGAEGQALQPEPEAEELGPAAGAEGAQADEVASQLEAEAGEPVPEADEGIEEPAPWAAAAAWETPSPAEARPAPQVDEQTVEPAPEADGGAAAPPREVDEPEPAPRARRPKLRGDPARTASWLDRLLVVIEVLAMLGLVAATFASLGLVDRLTNDVSRLGGSSATRPPTTSAPTPTPLPTPSVTPAPSGTARPAGGILPGGRDAVTPAPTQAAPAASLEGARITIEAISVDAPIVEGDDWETLKQGVGHHPGSALPGEEGNVVLAAHNDVYGAIFRKLSELREGDDVRIDTQAGTYRYQVTSIRIALPTETSVLAPDAGPALTLITCYPPLVDTHRVVVTAESVE